LNIDIQNRVILIPGNHDAPFLGKEPDARIRLRKYIQFTEDLFQDESTIDRQPRFIKRDDSNKLLLLALDTTLKTMSPRAEGEIGQGQLAWAETELKRIRRELRNDYERYRKIAIMHHHCISIPGGSAAGDRDMQLLDADGILSLLKTYSFDVILHGHRHIPHASHLVREDGAVLAVVGAGTTLAPYPDQQGKYGNSLNVIELDDALLEIRVTRWNASEDGSFTDRGSTKTFPIGRIPAKGYRINRLRRVAKISSNGDTHVTHHRDGVIVAKNERLKTLPLRIHCDTPGAAIKDFQIQRCDSCSVQWKIQEPQMFDGLFIFETDRTSRDVPASIIYEYTIEKGTVMRAVGNAPQFEEFSFTTATDVDDIEIEFEFPKGYTVQMEVRFEKNGSLMDANDYKDRYTLILDAVVNRWLFRFHAGKADCSITFSWKLPN
jgi:hypothetical protein